MYEQVAATSSRSGAPGSRMSSTLTSNPAGKLRCVQPLELFVEAAGPPDVDAVGEVDRHFDRGPGRCANGEARHDRPVHDGRQAR